MASNDRSRSGGRIVSGLTAAVVAGGTFLTHGCSDAPPVLSAPKTPEPVNICDEAMAKAEKSFQTTKDRWRDLVADAIKTCADQSAIEAALKKHPGAIHARADLNDVIATICNVEAMPTSVTRSTICNTNPEALKLREMLDKSRTK